MLSFTDPRFWFATAALAAGLVMTAGSANGTVRCGYYAGQGAGCFADQNGSATRIFRRMAGDIRRCSYVESACRVRDAADPGDAEPASKGAVLPPQ